jgi:hypothetical protein
VIVPPVVTPLGTVTVKAVAVALVTVAAVPANLTMLLAAVVEKPVPVIVIVPPTAKVVGLNEEYVGAATTVTVPEVRV